jgi:hypothetical protein
MKLKFEPKQCTSKNKEIGHRIWASLGRAFHAARRVGELIDGEAATVTGVSLCGGGARHGIATSQLTEN